MRRAQALVLAVALGIVLTLTSCAGHRPGAPSPDFPRSAVMHAPNTRVRVYGLAFQVMTSRGHNPKSPTGDAIGVNLQITNPFGKRAAAVFVAPGARLFGADGTERRQIFLTKPAPTGATPWVNGGPKDGWLEPGGGLMYDQLFEVEPGETGLTLVWQPLASMKEPVVFQAEEPPAPKFDFRKTGVWKLDKASAEATSVFAASVPGDPDGWQQWFDMGDEAKQLASAQAVVKAHFAAGPEETRFLSTRHGSWVVGRRGTDEVGVCLPAEGMYEPSPNGDHLYTAREILGFVRAWQDEPQ